MLIKMRGFERSRFDPSYQEGGRVVADRAKYQIIRVTTVECLLARLEPAKTLLNSALK
jgi:hypothetical protein